MENRILDNTTKVVRDLLKKSNSGDFIASSQLAKIYSEGIGGIEPDSNKAQEFKKKSATQLSGYSFTISSLKVINYKGFKSLDISFPPNGKGAVTVLVGNNGSGKSTILEAIQKSLTHISSRLTTRSYNGDQIEEIEIKNGSDFALIIPTFCLNEKLFSLELAQSRSLNEIKKKSKFTDINELGSLLRQANTALPDFSLPLLASYTVERANDVTTKDIEKSEEILNTQIWDKSKAYSKSLIGKADFRLFFRWFKEQIESENDGNVEIQKLRAQIKSKTEELDSPLLQALLSETSSPATKAYIDNYIAELDVLKQRYNSLSDINTKSLDVVREAIYKFLPGFSDLTLVRQPLDMTIKKEDETLSVLQLSQGEKSLLALVADIARRLTLLNSNNENPLNGTGIVLIDEIDLHLHPSWQQKIVKRLQTVFTNLQFIVTTHSPQVCHTIDSENIWLLKDGSKYKAPKGVRGAVSSWVLKNLFEVEVRPPEDTITLLLEEYSKLVYADKYNSPDALSAKQKLINHFGSDYDVLVGLDLYVENREWEKSIEENK